MREEEQRKRIEFEQQVIGIVSHDLRNPLNAIGLSASLMLRRGNLDDSQGMPSEEASHQPSDQGG